MHVSALVIEMLETSGRQQRRAAFVARARDSLGVYSALSAAGGDVGAVTEAQWQQLDGTDGKGRARVEAKAARTFAKHNREDNPIETEWQVQYALDNMAPKELAAVPLWDYADKLNSSEFLVLAQRQQDTRASGQRCRTLQILSEALAWAGIGQA